MRPRTDSELLAAAAGGEPEAFGEFFVRYAEVVLAFLRRRTPNAETAADLTAESFAAALAAVHAGAAEDISNGAAWLLTIARRKLIDSYRRGVVEQEARERMRIEPLWLHDEDVERIDELAHDEKLLSAALSELSAADRRIVLERVIDGRPYADMASELRTSELVVRKRVSRSLSKLRAGMEVRSR